MRDIPALRSEIKKMLVENCMLQIPAEEISDDQPLFGPGSLGLDSVDALQLVVALDKSYGLKVPDPEAARSILHSVNSMADAVLKTDQSKSA
jgi:acyl carrier protein